MIPPETLELEIKERHNAHVLTVSPPYINRFVDMLCNSDDNSLSFWLTSLIVPNYLHLTSNWAPFYQNIFNVKMCIKKIPAFKAGSRRILASFCNHVLFLRFARRPCCLKGLFLKVTCPQARLALISLTPADNISSTLLFLAGSDQVYS